MKAYLSQSTSDAEIERRRAIYQSLLADTNYQNIRFNPQNGGLMATHIGHNFTKSGGAYEKCVQKVGFEAGHVVILDDERGFDSKHTEGTWDGALFEISGRETATTSNILKGLKHCASKRTTEIALLYFPNSGFNVATLSKAVNRYKGLEKLQDGQFLKFKRIVCIQEEEIKIEIEL